MRVLCACGDWHEASPTALALIVQAYQDGDMQRVKGKEGVYSRCMEEAFTEARVAVISRRYPGNTIMLRDYRERYKDVG